MIHIFIMGWLIFSLANYQIPYSALLWCSLPSKLATTGGRWFESPAPPGRMPKCPWARYWALNCSWWAVSTLHGSLSISVWMCVWLCAIKHSERCVDWRSIGEMQNWSKVTQNCTSCITNVLGYNPSLKPLFCQILWQYLTQTSILTQNCVLVYSIVDKSYCWSLPEAKSAFSIV